MTELTAIDILINPDEAALARARALNARMLRSVPDGFALDTTHAPHVTTLQRFVRTADLDRVYDAVEKTIAETDMSALKLRAIAIRHADLGCPWARSRRTADPAQRRRAGLPDATSVRCLAVRRDRRNGGGIRDRRRSRHQPGHDRLGGGLCASSDRCRVRPSHHHWLRHPGGPERDRSRGIRCLRRAPCERGCVPPRQQRDSTPTS